MIVKSQDFLNDYNNLVISRNKVNSQKEEQITNDMALAEELLQKGISEEIYNAIIEVIKTKRNEEYSTKNLDEAISFYEKYIDFEA